MQDRWTPLEYAVWFKLTEISAALLRHPQMHSIEVCMCVDFVLPLRLSPLLHYR